MNRRSKLTAVILVFALALCLLPVSALALGGDAKEPELPDMLEAAPEDTALPAFEEAEAFPVPPDAVYNGPEDSLYTTPDSLVYNNGGTVYNNGGTVYNNGGLVYNNAGTVYNNAGTVYSNGGTVYNNAGLVYSNGAVIYSNNGSQEDSLLSGYNRVRFAADYSALADIEGMETDQASGVYVLEQDASCVIRPKEGLVIAAAETSSGSLEPGEDGAYILSGLESAATVFLRFKTVAPQFSLQPGTYSESLYVELTAPEGAIIYFTDDGSEPTVGQGRYTGPISVTQGAAIKAIAAVEGAEPSDVVEAAYAVLSMKAPVFEPQKDGYRRSASQPISVENPGPVDANVEKVELLGENADSFQLSTVAGKQLAAGKSSGSFWTIQPRGGLPVGTYTAVAAITLDSGEIVELELNFTVEEAPESES